jgi:hypothetical protein
MVAFIAEKPGDFSVLPEFDIFFGAPLTLSAETRQHLTVARGPVSIVIGGDGFTYNGLGEPTRGAIASFDWPFVPAPSAIIMVVDPSPGNGSDPRAIAFTGRRQDGPSLAPRERECLLRAAAGSPGKAIAIPEAATEGGRP